MGKRKQSRNPLLALSCVVLIALAWAAIAAQVSSTPENTRPAKVKKNANLAAQLRPVSAAPSAKPVLVGTLTGSTYTPEKAEPVSAVVRRFLPQTSYMTRSELETALREQNQLGKAVYLKKGQTIVVPGVEMQPIVENRVPVPPEFEVRAIYLTGAM